MNIQPGISFADADQAERMARLVLAIHQQGYETAMAQMSQQVKLTEQLWAERVQSVQVRPVHAALPPAHQPMALPAVGVNTIAVDTYPVGPDSFTPSPLEELARTVIQTQEEIVEPLRAGNWRNGIMPFVVGLIVVSGTLYGLIKIVPSLKLASSEAYIENPLPLTPSTQPVTDETRQQSLPDLPELPLERIRARLTGGIGNAPQDQSNE